MNRYLVESMLELALFHAMHVQESRLRDHTDWVTLARRQPADSIADSKHELCVALVCILFNGTVSTVLAPTFCAGLTNCRMPCIAGANADLRVDDNVTPLQLAAEMGHVEIMEALVKGGANVNMQGPDGDLVLLIYTIMTHCLNRYGWVPLYHCQHFSEQPLANDNELKNQHHE